MLTDRTELNKYDIKIIVAGTREYNDYKNFSSTIIDELEAFKEKTVIFISGKAKTGADALIIQWCKENNYPWVEFPADWDKYGKSAGYIRNEEMAKVATHLFAFHDGCSKGTKNMVDLATKYKLVKSISIINIINKEFTFFYGGPLSQWYPSTFVVKGITFNCAEQFMMYCKAMLFGDRMIANLILASKDPKEQKEYGRDVRGFREDIWISKREGYVRIGNLAKFSQNLNLKDYLLKTTGTELVEASKSDRIWGVGLDKSDPLINDRRNWRGLNLLGKSLDWVRDTLGNNNEI